MCNIWQKLALVVVSLGAAFQVTAQTTNELPDIKAYLDRGTASLKGSEWDKAISDFNAAIRLDSKIAVAYESRATAYFMKGNLDEALSDYGRAIQLEPTNARIYYNRGNAYREKRDLEKAAADLSESIRLNPTNDVAYKARADIYNQRGEFTKAIADATEGLRLNPNDAIALVMRGDSFSMNHQFDNAIQDYRQAIRLNPKHAKAYNGLAWLLATCPDAASRNGSEAVEAATRACELTNWKLWEYLDTLAASYAEAGNFQKAVEYEQQVIFNTRITESERADAQKRLKLYQQQKPYHADLKP